MAELDQISRKRMRLSSSLARTATITKPENQIHSSRSVSTASRAGNQLSGEKLVRKAVPRMYPRITIKDLRLRRVFPPASIANDLEFSGKKEYPNEHDKETLLDSWNSNGLKVDRLGEASVFTQTPPDTEQFSTETFSAQETRHSVSEKKNANLRTKSVLHPCSRAKIFKNPASVSYKRLLPYLMKTADDTPSSGHSSRTNKSFELVHPNINSQVSIENGKTRNGNTQDPKEETGKWMTVNDQCGENEHVLQYADSVSNKQCDGNSRGSLPPLKKPVYSSPNRKSVCSKRKLFRTPGSVNYRRLLPFLRDIPDDSPGVPHICNQPDTQKNAVENAENALSVSPVSENEGAQGMVKSDSTKEQCSSEKTGPKPLEGVSESGELSEPEKEQETQVKHVILDSEKHLENPCEVLGFETPLSSLLESRCSSDVASSDLNHSSVDTLVEEKNPDTEMMNGAEKLEDEMNAEKPEANALNSKALPPDASIVASGTPPLASPSKESLKRNLRGCKGLCTCLNCSSFRLHAERAFEFSRNQLQDAEETVLDLVGEISYLKDMLEKHASADGSESCTIQIKEACKKASEATEVAKSRLDQMNDDLQLHCRIPVEQGERVKFGAIQEKKIPPHL